MHAHFPQKESALTLIEFLVVIAIIAITKPGIAHAYNYTFSDNFASATVSSSVSGYNSWTVGDASDTQGGEGHWVIATSTSGNVAQWFPDSPSDYDFFLQYMANGKSTLSGTRLQADFEIPPAGSYNLSPSNFNYNPQFWLRRTTESGDGGGYLVLYQAGQWYINEHPAGTGGGASSSITLAQTTSTLTMATGTWYTGVFQAENNASGTPVLSFWVYPQGGTQPSQPMLTAIDASDTFNTGYFGLGTVLNSIDYTAVSVEATDTAALTITSPERAVAASSSVATLAITNSKGNIFYIPYIQTSSTLSVSATVGSSCVPAGGGVEFLLTNASTSQQQSQYVLNNSTSTYTALFTGLAKGTYTLDAHVVNADKIIQTGPADSDEATDIGIGDIISIIGDSIAAGYPVNYGLLSNWVQAESSSSIPVSLDGRNYPQEDYLNAQYEAGFPPELNNLLSAYDGYPVFLMNEGVSGYQASTYDSYMTSTQWVNRETALHPDKWLIELGDNDANAGVTSSTFEANMQTIVSNLENSYGASPSSIYMAKSVYPQSSSTAVALAQSYLPKIDALVANDHLSAGPNFFSYFEAYPDLYGSSGHPNATGYAEMADLWSLPFMSPQNVQTFQPADAATLEWGGLSGYNSQINGYKISYGTSSGNYTTTIDERNVTSATISGLTSGQTYYFIVFGYYSDPTSTTVNPTADSQEVSVLVTPPGPVIDVAAGYNTPPVNTVPVVRPSTPPETLSSTTTAIQTLSVIPSIASSSLVDELNALGAKLTALKNAYVAALSIPSTTSGSAFWRNLSLWSQGSDVSALQRLLIREDDGPAAQELAANGATGLFGHLTLNALIEFQRKAGIQPASGFFGPLTRSFINSILK